MKTKNSLKKDNSKLLKEKNEQLGEVILESLKYASQLVEIQKKLNSLRIKGDKLSEEIEKIKGNK